MQPGRRVLRQLFAASSGECHVGLRSTKGNEDAARAAVLRLQGSVSAGTPETAEQPVRRRALTTGSVEKMAGLTFLARQGILRFRGRIAARRAPDSACYIVAMPSGYLPIFIFLVVAASFPVLAILVAKLLRPSAPSVTKLEAYECGIKAASDSRGRYTVRFYIIAILFVIFDVETIFLFPWAVRYKSLGWFGVAEVAVFLAILVVGYIWAYKKGALEWV